VSEIYFSTDVETDGPIPGPHSMLSLGSMAMTADGEELGTFRMNLELLPGAKGDVQTMLWWDTKPDAWESAREDARDPAWVMAAFVDWVDYHAARARPVFVAYPAGFDFMFVYWYLIKFVGRSPFSFSAIDIKTYAMALLGKEYRDATKRGMPKEWFKGQPKHTHKALDDARGQGMLFAAMLKERAGWNR